MDPAAIDIVEDEQGAPAMQRRIVFHRDRPVFLAQVELGAAWCGEGRFFQHARHAIERRAGPQDARALDIAEQVIDTDAWDALQRLGDVRVGELVDILSGYGIENGGWVCAPSPAF